MLDKINYWAENIIGFDVMISLAKKLGICILVNILGGGGVCFALDLQFASLTTSSISATKITPERTYPIQTQLEHLPEAQGLLISSILPQVSYANLLQPQSSSSFYPVKIIDGFEGASDVVFTWWDIDGTKVYRRSFVQDVARSGTTSMEVKFKKTDANLAWSFFAFQPKQDGINNDFSKYDKLIFWLYVPKTFENRPLGLIVKFEDKKGRAWEKKFEFKPKEEWQLTELDLTKAFGVNLKEINNVLFFADPGKYPTAGQFWIDDIYLIQSKYSPAKEAPSIPQIIEIKEDFGILKVSWSDESSSGAVLYELYMADNLDFNNPLIFILNKTSLTIPGELKPGIYYFKIRALNHLLEFGGLASQYSQVYEFQYKEW